MATIEILEQDRLDAENLLEQILKDKVAGDYAKGTALHDLSITAFSNIFAYLRQEADLTRKRQSLLLLGQDEGDEVDDMVDEILSNFFITRKSGRQSRGVVTVYFSQVLGDGETLIVPPSVLFYKSSTLAFKPDSDVALSYMAANMFQVTTSTGSSGVYTPVVEYAIRIPVIAVNTGAQYDIDPGIFINWQLRHPYITRVENTSTFSGGADKETTAAMLERAPTAISVRDLNSARSIDSVLRDEFTEINSLFVAGMGDPEMMRDLISEEATNLWIHAGGYTDIYLNNPLAEGQEHAAVVGSVSTDPRPGYHVLRDATIDSFLQAGGDLTAAVERGFIVQIYNNLPSEPNQYIVSEATDYGLLVSARTPFPRALPTTEEAFTADAMLGITNTGGVDRIASAGMHVFTTDDIDKYIYVNSTTDNHGTYRITDVNVSPNYAVVIKATGLAPSFVNETAKDWSILTEVVDYSIGKVVEGDILPRRYSGRFTKDVQRSGFIALPAMPAYRISDVYIVNGTDPLSVDGRITFLNRTNRSVVLSPTGGDPSLLEYRLWIRNPSEAQSGWQLAELQIGWNDPLGTVNMARFDGMTLHVEFDTLSGYDSIWEYTLDRNRRVACASVIPRGLHPVYVSMNVQYSHAATAVAALDESAAALALANYITNYETLLTLDVSDIVSFLRQTFDMIGYIALPLTVNYDLFAPDGRVIHYQTTNRVIVDKSKYHPSYLGDQDSHLDDPLVYGVTSRTLRPLSTASLITFEVV